MASRNTPSNKNSLGHFTSIYCEVCGTRIPPRKGYKARNTPRRCKNCWPDSQPRKVK